MKKSILLLAIVGFISASVLRADSPPPPPVPVPPSEGSDEVPPPPQGDLESPTLPQGTVNDQDLPPIPKDALKSLGDTQATPSAGSNQAPTAVSTPSESSSDNLPPIPQAPAQNTPTPTAFIKKIAKATPTPVVEKAAPPEPPLPSAGFQPSEQAPSAEPPAGPSKGSSSAAVAGGGQLSDYFPTAQGTKWTYEYLKAAQGQTAKGTLTVEVLSQKQMPNGTSRVVLETTEGGNQVRDRYSLYDNKVEHTLVGDQLLKGDFAFKLPTAGGATYWTVTEKNGMVHKSKAAFGQAQVYQKVYPDCVVVTEKIMKGNQLVNTVIYYYAKGLGLVAVEVYSKNKQLIQDKSFALVSGQ
jgi:hypothetical protein